MRLEVGKKYVRRDGVVEEVALRHGDVYPFHAASGECWTENGYFWSNGEKSEADLISEYIEPKQTGFVVGEIYERADGYKCKCIHIESDRAYCASFRDGEIFGPAYMWTLDGEYLNATQSERANYRITFAPKVEWVKRAAHYNQAGDGDFYSWHQKNPTDQDHNLNITFPLINGKPDWSQAKIEAV